MLIHCKTKKKKKDPNDLKRTVHSHHKQKLEEFITLENKLPSLRQELKKLENEKNEILKNTNGFALVNPVYGKKLYELNILIKNLQLKIADIETGNLKKSYLSKTAHILYNYYNDIKGVSNRNVGESDNKIPQNKNITTQNQNIIPQHTTLSTYLDVGKKSNDISNRALLFDQYIKITNPREYVPSHPIKKNIDTCHYCNVEMALIQSEGFIVCPQCGREEGIIIDSEKPSYKDPPPEAGEFTYKRINRFDEWLTQYQAKETTEIPKEVLDNILNEMKKEGFNNVNKLSMEKVRAYLKKLGLNKYYEHIPHIIYCLNGLPTPKLKQETEEKLRSMFRQIQDIFDQVCPNNRTNFLSYSYLLRKLLELLGEDEHMMYFRLHKSREKIYQHDKVWQKICAKLNWEYIRTI
jgi:predicted RNA-binding Zn-ribbon protein involved in translation (DUF1610 family)